jgi:hypothetical protein
LARLVATCLTLALQWWNTLREMCDHHNNLPSPLVLEKWLAEPIKFLYVPTSIFIFNAKASGVLVAVAGCFLTRLHRLTAPHMFSFLCLVVLTERFIKGLPHAKQAAPRCVDASDEAKGRAVRVDGRAQPPRRPQTVHTVLELPLVRAT